jgi:hypothetical protein
MFWLAAPLKFVEVRLNSKSTPWWSPLKNFNRAKAYKNLFSAGVEAAATLRHSDTQKDLLMYCKCFDYAFLLNQQNYYKSYQNFCHAKGKTLATFYFLTLCRQLLSLGRYRWKNGKVHCKGRLWSLVVHCTRHVQEEDLLWESGGWHTLCR